MSYAQIREQREAVFTMLSLLAAAGVVLFAGFQVALGRLNLRWVRRQERAIEERSRMVSDRARQRLARDLHDGPVQDLVGASYLVDGALQSMRSGQVPQAEQLSKLDCKGHVRLRSSTQRVAVHDGKPVPLFGQTVTVTPAPLC